MFKTKWIDSWEAESKLRDWRFWYKLLAGILVLIGITMNLSVELISLSDSTPEDLRWSVWHTTYGSGETGIDYAGYLGNFFSYFTIQTNILVAIWFFAAAFSHKQEGLNFITKSKISYAVATYITITCLIYNFLLLPTTLSMSKTGMDALTWTHQQILHTVVPILMVLYVCFFIKRDKTPTTKVFIKNNWWIYMIYPLLYGVFALIRGEMRYISDKPVSTQYPYFFLNIHLNGKYGPDDYPIPGLSIPGWAWFLIAMSLVTFIAIGFSAIFNKIYFEMWFKDNYKDTLKKDKAKVIREINKEFIKQYK
ncbi:Pr6Pr family membrane protein [Spiroplasma sp. BIUS-1]|uniref:Pr6Pr family membrane protein n=1 Tax=Spiroplasma sp. BIUS-1 TaxID=216964 RepID=UPI001397F61F|nr:Pr6Pr family membrane protein [Spiroplasma sp. BIUS-1]QHX36732.1 hypothetical protein SBIUS_v1c04790 [Spiroplasma sp. BIUS-1]